MKYLLDTTEKYRVSSEDEATALIEEAKNEKGYILTKYSSQYKEKKQKGEIVDYFWLVSLTKEFNKQSDPNNDIDVEYKLNSAF